MFITLKAVDAILKTMESKGLDPKTVFMEIGIFDGNLGIAFTRDKFGKVIDLGGLNVIFQNNLEFEDITVDFVEVDGKTGLIFKEREIEKP